MGEPPARAEEHRDRWLEPDDQAGDGRELPADTAEPRADLENRGRAKAADESLPEREIPAAERLELVERKDSLVVGIDLGEVFGGGGGWRHASRHYKMRAAGFSLPRVVSAPAPARPVGRRAGAA